MSDGTSTDARFPGLAAGVRPEQIDEFVEAQAILPIFPLVRSLFSLSPEDSTLKLIILFTLAQTEGRFTRERIRTLVRSIEPDRLEALVTSLHGGGWLELRARDNSYRLNPMGLFLLATLRAANFASQAPSNLLVRAAEALVFGARVDEGGTTTTRLMGMLLAELETQADRAREVIASGRPRALMRFSREEVRAQLDRVTEVLALLEQDLEEASTHFGRIVRLHRAMQLILTAHEGLHRRLAEWSLRRLETTDAGYSLSALCDAVMSADDAELFAGPGRAIHWPGPVQRVSTDELLNRHTTERRARTRGREAFVYEAPPEPVIEQLEAARADPLLSLRAALAERLAELAPGESIRWSTIVDGLAADFAEAALQLALLARLHGQGRDDVVALDGVAARLGMPDGIADAIRGLNADSALTALRAMGAVGDLGERGLHVELTLTREADV